MKYYIADTHFGHHKLLSFAKRPFSSIHEMEKVLISNWNQIVHENDEVYIIGDLFYRENHPERILAQLKGKKILILGNHDARWLTEECKTYFTAIHTHLEIIDQNHSIYLCHYPMVSYPKQSRAYMIHGHIHNDTLFDYWCILLKRPRILNAGVDINHFKPVTFNELVFNNTDYKQKMLESYPMYILSVRLTERNEEIEHWLKERYSQITLSEIHEGIYHIPDYLSSKDVIHQIQTEILKDSQVSSFLKNFDVVYVDSDGRYSYISYLHLDTIYLK